jgi:hypothetical protein
VFKAKIDNPFHRTTDVVPVGLEAFGGFLPAQAPSPGGEEMTEGIATGMFPLCPWDSLYFDTASWAVHPPHGVGKKDGDVPDRDKLELAGTRHMIIPWTMFCTAGANGSGVGSRDNRGDDLWLAAPCVQFDRLVNEALERVDFVE